MSHETALRLHTSLGGLAVGLGPSLRPAAFTCLFVAVCGCHRESQPMWGQGSPPRSPTSQGTVAEAGRGKGCAASRPFSRPLTQPLGSRGAGVGHALTPWGRGRRTSPEDGSSIPAETLHADASTQLRPLGLHPRLGPREGVRRTSHRAPGGACGDPPVGDSLGGVPAASPAGKEEGCGG